MEGAPGEKVARVRLGSYELKKKGISRFDLRDPYHLAVALTWPAIPRGLAVTLSVVECRLRHPLLAGSRFGGEYSAG